MRQAARSNVAALAGRLGVSRGTVTNRLCKLEDGHVIVGYTVRLRADSNAALAGVLERVRLIKGIANTETSILLATFR